MTPEEEIRRAGEARQLLDTGIFLEARRHVEEQLATIRRTVPLRDTDMHTRVILMGQLWDNLLGYFEQIAQTGQLAELEIRKKQEQAGLIERGIAMFRTSGRNSL